MMDVSTADVNPSNPHTAWRDLSGEVAWPTIALMLVNMTTFAVVWALALQGLLPLALGCAILSVNAYVVFTVMHEASHGNIDGGDSRAAWIEELFGWISAAILLAPYPIFRAVHLNHHAHANDPEKDPDHWVVSKNPLSLVLRCLTVPFYYYYWVLRGSELDSVKKQRFALITCLLSFGAVIAGLTVAGYGVYVLALWVAPALIAGGFLAMVFDWLPHYPHMATGRFHDTRILLIRSLTVPLLWQNYHLIHHLHPRVPFYRYGICFREIRPMLEREGAAIEGFAKDLKRPFETDLGHVTRPEPTRERRTEHRVRVTRVVHETPDAVAMYFEPIGDWSMQHEAGQFMTFEVEVDGEVLHRCYSLFTPPGAPNPGVCAKRIPEGRVSGWLKQHARPGLELVARPPAGRFAYAPSVHDRSIVLIGGGSGITPLRSIAETALRADKQVTLLYGNRDEGSIIFREAFDALEREFERRFTVRHILADPTPTWNGGRGMLDRATTTAELERLPQSTTRGADYFVCGPAPMMAEANAALEARGVTQDRIHQEHFVAQGDSGGALLPDGPTHSVTFDLDGEPHTVKASESETLLDAALRENVPVRYSCRSGNCGSCMLKLTSGNVEQRNDDNALLATEREAGFVLACCTQARSEVELQTATTW